MTDIRDEGLRSREDGHHIFDLDSAIDVDPAAGTASEPDVDAALRHVVQHHDGLTG